MHLLVIAIFLALLGLLYEAMTRVARMQPPKKTPEAAAKAAPRAQARKRSAQQRP